MYNSNNYYQPKYNNMPNTLGQQTYPSYQPVYTPPMTPPIAPQIPVQEKRPNELLGKVVDRIEVVGATDIPLDGSVSYFPLIDGSAIITKQVQPDGTSKMVIYRPTEPKHEEQVRYATIDDVRNEINSIDLSEIDDLRQEIEDLKKQLREQKANKKKVD